MIYIFDVDGTLTEPRQKINEDFAKVFKKFCEENIVYLVTGSDKDKVYEQMGADILENYVVGVFSSMGNVLQQKGKTLYENDFNFSQNLINDLEKILSNYSLLKTGNHIEYRKGMINFSLIGRNATQEQRDLYAKDQEAQAIRKNVVEYLQNIYKHEGLEFYIGGQISIDIQPRNKDKRQAVRWIKERMYSEQLTFFGDKTHEGGNDYTIAQAVREHGGKVFQVENWKDTERFLKCS